MKKTNILKNSQTLETVERALVYKNRKMYSHLITRNIKWIIVIIMIVIITSGVSVYATATYLASNISYTKSGTNINTVADALNDLYGRTTELDTLKTNINLTDATASDIVSGKKAYTQNGLVEGIFNKKVEKQSVGSVTYTFTSCSTSENYKNCTDTKIINIAEIFPNNYVEFTENNFSYQVTSVKNATANSTSNWCYGANFSNSPTLNYDNKSGILSLTINVRNGYHDYISEVKANLFIFK